MRAISLLYHDVIKKGEFDSSGFPGLTAAKGKLEITEFESHLTAIAKVIKNKPALVLDFLSKERNEFPLFLTFDDGGSSAYTYIANMLENFGWLGHFFITANYVDTPSFVSANQIRALRAKGHIIGSHSCSHPTRMSYCSWQGLVEEWEKSIEILSDILGEQVIVASVPGGYYLKKVAETASFAGIKALFTSEPTTRCQQVHECLVLGRFSLRRGSPSEVAAGLASGEINLRLRQFLFWNSKKIAKYFGGRTYLKIRKFLLEHSRTS
jgi:peptidoglycan/xylan/chitin deacetylase (PgdA/CDA1 family)